MTDIPQIGMGMEGRVDRIERLHRDPPEQWDRTAWGIDRIDGDTVLVEVALVACPECGSWACWRQGVMGCGNCETRKRMVG